MILYNWDISRKRKRLDLIKCLRHKFEKRKRGIGLIILELSDFFLEKTEDEAENEFSSELQGVVTLKKLIACWPKKVPKAHLLKNRIPRYEFFRTLRPLQPDSGVAGCDYFRAPWRHWRAATTLLHRPALGQGTFAFGRASVNKTISFEASPGDVTCYAQCRASMLATPTFDHSRVAAQLLHVNGHNADPPCSRQNSFLRLGVVLLLHDSGQSAPPP
jgi:hypothetical protein